MTLIRPYKAAIESLDTEEAQRMGVRISIQREDLAHPFISGNKWRKLRYILEEAKIQNVEMLVSFGGAYSNHLVALACAGAMFGFRTAAFVRGEAVDNHMLHLCRLWRMDLRFVTREDYRDKDRLFSENFGAEACMIDEGGKGIAAARGCAEMLDDVPADVTHVVCPVGTGTTLAGLARAAWQKGIRAEGICVLKGAQDIDRDIARIVSHTNWTVHHHYHRGGYGKADEELDNYIRRFILSRGIVIDHVYTGKMLMAVEDLVSRGYFPGNSHIVVIHTGGALGLLGRPQVLLTA